VSEIRVSGFMPCAPSFLGYDLFLRRRRRRRKEEEEKLGGGGGDEEGAPTVSRVSDPKIANSLIGWDSEG
jgi:hypothetical protein